MDESIPSFADVLLRHGVTGLYLGMVVDCHLETFMSILFIFENSCKPIAAGISSSSLEDRATNSKRANKEFAAFMFTSLPPTFTVLSF